MYGNVINVNANVHAHAPAHVNVNVNVMNTETALDLPVNVNVMNTETALDLPGPAQRRLKLALSNTKNLDEYSVCLQNLISLNHVHLHKSLNCDILAKPRRCHNARIHDSQPLPSRK